MATKTSQEQSSSPFARLSRFGVGLGLKSHSPPTYAQEPEEDWYIAYHGPYEVPKDTRKRDSWGDVVEEEGRDAILDAELVHRYGGGKQGVDNVDHGRGRAYSTTTASSGTTDTNRKRIRSPQPRSGNPKRGPISSFINLDAAGGVGDSPMPPQRFPVNSPSANQVSANRTGMANFFLKRPSSSSGKKASRSPSTRSRRQPHGESRPTSSVTRKSTSLDLPRSRPQGPAIAVDTKRNPTGDDDYYNSYYSTLVSTPKSTGAFGSRPNTAGAKTSDPGPVEHTHSAPDTHKYLASAHPYSYAFSSQRETEPVHTASAAPSMVRRPSTAPLLHVKHDPKDSVSSTSHQDHRNAAQLLMSAKNPAGIHRGRDNLKVASLAPLKSSVSTPNLRQGQLPPSPISPHLPKGIDRLFSAESWCDALILPRPRFKVNNRLEAPDNEIRVSSTKSSGRIVSPPLTPIAQSADLDNDTNVVERQSFPERREQIAQELGPKPRNRLTKSKSATSLRATEPSINPAPFPDPSITTGHYRANSKGKGRLQKRRPRDLVLHDLALQSEPSLDKVLDQGDQLQEQRQRWQAQATKSLGNKATRSLSRGRAKSLNHKDARRHRKNPSHIDFLTTRTLLGSQGVAPTIVVRPPGSHGTKTETGTSSKSHSHSDSHGTQSSQSHRRHDSWGQHALKYAKYTASGALCGIQDDSHTSPMDEKAAAVEGAITAVDPKAIRLRDKGGSREEDGFVVIDKTLFTKSVAPVSVSDPADDLAAGPSSSTPVSPTPSGATGNEVGIALSTPPVSDDQSRETYESMSMPRHPYAHGAMYSYHPHKPVRLELVHGPANRGSDYAGPHPSSPTVAPSDFPVDASDVSVRHRLPPQATLQPHMAHPYAMASHSAISHAKPDSPVRQNEPLSPAFGFDASINMAHAYARVSTGNPEILGFGEALTSSRRQGGREAGLGTVGNQSVQDQAHPGSSETRRPDSNSQTWPLRVRRKPVSYADYDEDPSSASQEISPPSPSPDYLNTPKFQRDASESTVGNSSGSSPLHSPRPLGNVDDLDRFHDLFYEPDQPNLSTSSSASRRNLVLSGSSHDTFPLDVGSSRSGLSSLARKLTEEYEDRISQEVPSDIDNQTLTQGQRFDGLQGQRHSRSSSDRELVFSDPSKRRAASPGPMESTLPLHLDNDETGPDENVPENVGSSRASSILERASINDDTFGLPLRLGAVEALATPPPVIHDHRALRHVSLVPDQVEIQEEAPVKLESQMGEAPRATSEGSLAPPVISADPTRSSYMTSTTDGSRMSGLSDFPEPPPVEHLTPAHMSIIHSYYGGDNPRKQIEDSLSSISQATISKNGRLANHRLTFGGSENIDHVVPAIPDS